MIRAGQAAALPPKTPRPPLPLLVLFGHQTDVEGHAAELPYSSALLLRGAAGIAGEGIDVEVRRQRDLLMHHLTPKGQHASVLAKDRLRVSRLGQQVAYVG